MVGVNEQIAFFFKSIHCLNSLLEWVVLEFGVGVFDTTEKGKNRRTGNGATSI